MEETGDRRVCRFLRQLPRTGQPETARELVALIASAADRELAKYIEYLKEENKILRERIPGQIHTKPSERERLIKFGKALGRAIEELITIVSPSTFYRWLRDGEEKSVKNPKGGQRKPREIRELVILIAKTTGFGLTRIIGELRKSSRSWSKSTATSRCMLPKSLNTFPAPRGYPCDHSEK